MIKNKTRKKVLSRNVKHCKNDLQKASGLMFSRKKKDFGLVFFFRKPIKMSLHMWFVFYPIDVVFLDERSRVIEMKENFRPFSFYTTKKEAKYFIEVPEGTIKKSKTKIGDEMSF